MTDAQIKKVLAQHKPIAAVLLAKGGWLRASTIRIRVAFPADESPAVWVIELVSEDEPWHSVYVEAATIVGISVISHNSRLP